MGASIVLHKRFRCAQLVLRLLEDGGIIILLHVLDQTEETVAGTNLARFSETLVLRLQEIHDWLLLVHTANLIEDGWLMSVHDYLFRQRTLDMLRLVFDY